MDLGLSPFAELSDAQRSLQLGAGHAAKIDSRFHAALLRRWRRPTFGGISKKPNEARRDGLEDGFRAARPAGSAYRGVRRARRRAARTRMPARIVRA
jgi:hypothetical protein